MHAPTLSRRLRRQIRLRAERVLDRLHLVDPRPEPGSPAPKENAPVPLAPEPSQPEGLDAAAVQEVLDEMVRPALQADGGDITLVKVEGNDVYVRLVGACSSCPSSVLTMKMGVERLLKEEFPSFGELVQLGEYQL